MTVPVRVSRVLVAVDFDQSSVPALRMAGMLAAAWKADVTVFYATTQEAPAYFTAAQIGALEAEHEQSRAVDDEQLRAFAGPHLPGSVRVRVGEGPPQDAILRAAPSFDLIVVGTHRRRGPRRWWLGSVAEAVVRNSPRPVLVVPTDAPVPEGDRSATILALESTAAALEPWADLLTTAFRGSVVRSVDLSHCAPDLLRHADVVVLPLSATGGTHAPFGEIVQVLKECVHPVLFVPSAVPIVERSQS